MQRRECTVKKKKNNASPFTAQQQRGWHCNAVYSEPGGGDMTGGKQLYINNNKNMGSQWTLAVTHGNTVITEQ
jgi:hypothetical protein